MKKLVLLILMPFILGILNVSAQSELNDFEGETTESQKTRAALLFELFPELQKAYSLTHSLRMIFSNKFASKDSTRLSFNNKQHYKWHYHKAHSFLQPLPCTILV